MRLNPRSPEDLSQQLNAARISGSRVDHCDLAELNQVLEYHPEDMTATVQAGVSLSKLQGLLHTHRQWLPLDPPLSESLSIGELISQNANGPRRYGYGTVRDYVIGMKIALADGQIIKSGGKVVKNVAGYDLCKLFIGSKGTLGIITEATFKLRPLPEKELIVQAFFDTLDQLDSTAERILQSEIEPVIFDADNLEDRFRLVLAMAGASEDVEAQARAAADLGFNEAATLDVQLQFCALEQIRQVSVLPSMTAKFLQKIVPAYFVARYGNGVIYTLAALPNLKPAPPLNLTHRIKSAYDPTGVFPHLEL